MLHEHDGAFGLGRHAIEWDRIYDLIQKPMALALAPNCICTIQTLVGFLKRRFIRVCVWVRVLWMGNEFSY